MDAAASFVFEIEPLLETKCFACHGKDPSDLEGDLNLTTRSGMLSGGSSGSAALVPGDIQESRIISVIKRLNAETAMPPKNAERLSASEITLFEQWIKAGAPWPDDEQKKQIIQDPKWKGKEKLALSIDGALSESWSNRTYKREDLWAYQPVAVAKIPDGVHPIDFFINKKLEENNLIASNQAERSDLIKRAYYDLTGLPPDYNEVRNFINASSQYAYLKILDTLLASSAYGEQMARMWLDVVRYADSDGFSNDYVRPNAWRYRDYVIRSFNEDKPYNQFVFEQLAGDEMDPSDPEMLIATGYLRMGPWEHTSMSVAKETRQLYLDDVINNVGETFLSTPLMCAKCHDHKFDPIPSHDYYSMQAVFATTQFAERPAPFLEEENTILIEGEKKRIEQWIKRTKSEETKLKAKEENAAKKWFIQKNKPYLTKKQRRSLPDSDQPPRYYGLSFADLGYRKVLQKRMQTLQKLQLRFEPFAYSVYNGEDRIHHSGQIFDLPEKRGASVPKTYILQAGSVFSPSAEVGPGILQAIPAVFALEGKKSNLNIDLTTSVDGRRKKLAAWLTNPDHPIVVRSIVNRIWQMHFGKALVEDPNNFGINAKKPTHPELLDWLAHYFIKNGWSIKKLHRLIMTSEVYQRTCQPVDLRQEMQDPNNYWLAHFTPRRLAAEEIRDGFLLVSGELNKILGGIPSRPEINMEVALQPRHTMGSIAQAYQPDRTPEERNRRSIYVERIRSLDNPLLSVFNQPRTENSCGRRNYSTVTPQVYALFNNMQVHYRALALAIDLQKKTKSKQDQIREAIQRTWLREPTATEVSDGEIYLEKMEAYHQQNDAPKINYPKEVRRKMFEEMTGEPFDYTEQLDIFENYIPDTQYADVAPKVRALADFCLLLFNSNEFIYVY